MTARELTTRQMGENLDQLMNLDPRGYGLCRILYPASRALAGEPVSLSAARLLKKRLSPGDCCLVLTGFVLLPHECPETDGLVSALLLCRVLTGLLNVTPVLVCPEECFAPAAAMAAAEGLHLYVDLDKARSRPASAAFIPFPKDARRAEAEAKALLDACTPSAAVAIELPGANEKGVYHNAQGQDVSWLEAKTDLLLPLLQERGVSTIAIGDLGNEAGLAALRPQLERCLPYMGEGACRCGCCGGIAASTFADRIVTAAASDWGCCALMAALCFLEGAMDWMPGSSLYEQVLTAGVRAGLVDMGGWKIPAVDSFGTGLLLPVVELMKETCRNALAVYQSGEYDRWFQGVLEKRYWEEKTV